MAQVSLTSLSSGKELPLPFLLQFLEMASPVDLEDPTGGAPTPYQTGLDNKFIDDTQVFAVEIYSQKSERTRIDWRRYYPDLNYGIHQFPKEIEQKLLQLVILFNLQFSSADFILTPDGTYYFLELNPNGQFYWLEPPTGLPMAEAMANLLVSPEEYRLC